MAEGITPNQIVGIPIYSSDNLPGGPIILNDAQIKALPTTPFEVLPAPGAGKMNVFLSGIMSTTIVEPYTNIDVADGSDGGVLSITSPASDNLIVSSLTPSDAMLVGTRNALMYPQANISDDAAWIFSNYDPEVNGGFFLQAYNTGNFTGGDVGNSLKVSFLYTIINV